MKEVFHLERAADSSSSDFLVVVATQCDRDSFIETPLHKSLIDQDYQGDLAVYLENKQGLCEIYNKALRAAYKRDYKTIVFVHDDVYIDSCNFTHKVREGLQSNDVIGLAGGSRIKVEKPLLWHLMTDKRTHSGTVSHRGQYGIAPTFFGPHGPVQLLDGLFLAMKPEIVNTVSFDENITGFHHYDLKFSVDCVQASLKLSTVPIHVIHESPGLTKFTDDFNKSEQYLYEHLVKLRSQKS